MYASSCRRFGCSFDFGRANGYEPMATRFARTVAEKASVGWNIYDSRSPVGSSRQDAPGGKVGAQ